MYPGYLALISSTQANAALLEPTRLRRPLAWKAAFARSPGCIWKEMDFSGTAWNFHSHRPEEPSKMLTRGCLQEVIGWRATSTGNCGRQLPRSG